MQPVSMLQEGGTVAQVLELPGSVELASLREVPDITVGRFSMHAGNVPHNPALLLREMLYVESAA